ncbi:ATP-binding protein [Alkanindiges hydrocarboniclasticus]|uniref:Iron-sulfur cluster carrier protein n=2 Tax=Alkanindiges hydrocarboniclasticus TaxID=1907941 RepID=A0A1S8CWU0_9GAMM|nr:ATP-binding protein [Alkanindiges hydrocarboniclasticus]
MSWFKPFKMEFAPFAEFGNPQVDEILQAHYLPNTQHPILSLVTQRQQQNDVLGLTLKLPAGYQVNSEADFEQLHNSLASALEKVGIRELNLHFVTQKASGTQHERGKSVSSTAAQELRPEGYNSVRRAQSNLPPVIDAQEAPSNSPLTRGELPPVIDAQAQAQPIKSEAVQREDELTSKRPAPSTQSQLKAHPRIKNVIVVASGKGGVGKSTTTVNLALALQQTGAKVGVLDADIYGPSVPTMLGTAGKTPLIENEQFIPLEAYGMAVLSIGNLTGDDNTPVVWRGPKATGALMQLFNQTAWPDLDYLLIDMPPGTGDIQLTLAQRIPVTGAVIVTTPQHVALMDAQKGIELFNKVNIPVLGVVENMSTHVCSNCGHTDEIFGTGGGDKLSAAYQVPLLGRLPLNASIRHNADQGKPSVIANDAAAIHYKDIALAMLVQLAKIPSRERDSNRIF